LEKWKQDEKISFKQFLSDTEKQNSVCYNMLISIQCAIDLGNFIIEKKGLEIASTYSEVFQILEKNKIINKKLADELSFLARFRNALAHIYWKIDLKKVYRVLKTKRTVLEKFLKFVKNYPALP